MMPDWLTHVLIGWGVANFLVLKRKDFELYKAALIIGSILPDIWHIRILIDYVSGINLTWPLYAFHTPLGAAVVAVLIGLLFLKEKYRKQGTLFLMGGVSIHFCLDLMLNHIEGGHYLLFPFSKQLYELKIFWPETFTFLWIALVFWGISQILSKKLNTITASYI